MKRAIAAICILIVLFLGCIRYLTDFLEDIDSAEANAQKYCKMVYEGHWPDYQQTYDKFCNGPKWNGK